MINSDQRKVQCRLIQSISSMKVHSLAGTEMIKTEESKISLSLGSF